MSVPKSTVESTAGSTVEAVSRSQAAELAERICTLWEQQGHGDLPAAIKANPCLTNHHSIFLDLVDREYQLLRDGLSDSSPAQYCDRFAGLNSNLRHSIYKLVDVERHLAAVSPSDVLRLVQGISWPKESDLFGDFLLLEELGRGAIGRVFLCEQRSLGDRRVVVKVTPSAQAEATIIGRLTHPNVSPVFSTGEDAETGLGWICMPFLGRVTLQHVIREASDPSFSRRGSRVESITVYRQFAQVAEGLGYVHENGLIHGDLKPSNILLTDADEPMLIDFNLSRDRSVESGIVGGTLPYMAPEQLRAMARKNGAADCHATLATETFSFGVVLYEALTGAHPFLNGDEKWSPDKTVAELLASQERWPADRAAMAGIDRRAFALVRRCLAPLPEDRPRSMTEVARDLNRLCSPMAKVYRMFKAKTAFASLLAVAALAVFGWASSQRDGKNAAVKSATKAEAGIGEITSLGDLSGNPSERRKSAGSLLQKGEIDRAISEYVACWRLSDDPLDLAMAGYCRNRQGQPALAANLYEEAKRHGIVSAATECNLGVSLLQIFARHPDTEASEAIASSLMRAYQLDEQNETVRLAMLTHSMLAYARNEEALPPYPIDIARLPNDRASNGFCTRAAKFLVRRQASRADLIEIGLPCLERLAATAGHERVPRLVGSNLIGSYQDLPGYQGLAMVEGMPATPEPPQFLNPATFPEN